MMLPGFICHHVARENVPGNPVLLITRDLPDDDDDADTGLGMYCGAPNHTNEDYRIVDLDRVIADDPTLREVVESLQPLQMATRSSAEQPWIVEQMPIEEAA